MFDHTKLPMAFAILEMRIDNLQAPIKKYQEAEAKLKKLVKEQKVIYQKTKAAIQHFQDVLAITKLVKI